MSAKTKTDSEFSPVSFGEGNSRKSQINHGKSKNHIYFGIYNLTKTQNSNRDDSKTLFNHAYYM